MEIINNFAIIILFIYKQIYFVKNYKNIKNKINEIVIN